MAQVRANVGALARLYKSEQERLFSQIASVLLADEFGVKVERIDYEPVTWNLPGNRYTPDFVAILEDGRIVHIEVKGSRKQRGYRDARSKLREAASIHPEYTWVEAIVTLRRGQLESVSFEVVNSK